jgi:hypothetical protein
MDPDQTRTPMIVLLRYKRYVAAKVTAPRFKFVSPVIPYLEEISVDKFVETATEHSLAVNLRNT